MPGSENPADMGTKGLNWELIERFTRMLGMEHRDGRAELAPELAQAMHTAHCRRHKSNAGQSGIARRFPKAQKVSLCDGYGEKEQHGCCKASPQQGACSHTAQSSNAKNAAQSGDPGLWVCPSREECGCNGCEMFCITSERYF